MQCELERERLSAYLDRELPREEYREVAAHIGSCPHCAAALAELREVGRLIAVNGREPPPKELRGRLAAALLAAAARPSRWAQRGRPARCAAAPAHARIAVSRRSIFRLDNL